MAFMGITLPFVEYIHSHIQVGQSGTCEVQCGYWCAGGSCSSHLEGRLLVVGFLLTLERPLWRIAWIVQPDPGFLLLVSFGPFCACTLVSGAGSGRKEGKISTVPPLCSYTTWYICTCQTINRTKMIIKSLLQIALHQPGHSTGYMLPWHLKHPACCKGCMIV